jgi:hypothetical protein
VRVFGLRYFRVMRRDERLLSEVLDMATSVGPIPPFSTPTRPSHGLFFLFATVMETRPPHIRIPWRSAFHCGRRYGAADSSGTGVIAVNQNGRGIGWAETLFIDTQEDRNTCTTEAVIACGTVQQMWNGI